MPELTLFISHRSSDSALAKALVELFEKALKLPARQIRCTSVDGYRLPVGADTDEQLRREVFESRAFIGLITPASVASAYVLFELGARWGARKHLAPLLARGADAAALGGPLSGINALRGDQRNQVVQLMEDIAEYLELQLEPAPSFQGAIDAVVAQAAISETLPQQQRASRPSEPTFEPDESEVKILALVAGGMTDPKQISVRMNLPLEKTNYHLHRLSSANMVNNIGMYDVIYKVLQPGRALLVTRGLL